MKLVHCFGAGLVGSFVARKLAESGCIVSVYDIEPKNSMFEVYKNITVHVAVSYTHLTLPTNREV